MGDLDGKVAVVLGASGQRSFGSTIARTFAAQGARVVVAARRREPLEALAREIGGLAITCDIARNDEIEALAARTLNAFGRLDVAVNSAGSIAWSPIAELTPELITPTLEVSFTGTLLFFRHMGNAIARSGGGSVITISSLTAQLPGLGYGVYSAARAGIDYAVKVAALEYGPQKVRFNAIAAGLIETDMTAELFRTPGIEELFARRTPLRRMGTPEDIARVALWLADGQASGFVSGEKISVSGGSQNGSLGDA